MIGSDDSLAGLSGGFDGGVQHGFLSLARRELVWTVAGPYQPENISRKQPLVTTLR